MDLMNCLSPQSAPLVPAAEWDSGFLGTNSATLEVDAFVAFPNNLIIFNTNSLRTLPR